MPIANFVVIGLRIISTVGWLFSSDKQNNIIRNSRSE